jgi:hypothetical protein
MTFGRRASVCFRLVSKVQGLVVVHLLQSFLKLHDLGETLARDGKVMETGFPDWPKSWTPTKTASRAGCNTPQPKQRSSSTGTKEVEHH